MAKHPPCPPLHRPNRAARPAASAPACYRNRAAVTNGVIAGAAGYIPRQLSRKTGSHLPQTTPRLLPGGGSAASHRPAPRRPHRWRKRHRGNAWRHRTTAAPNSVGKRRRAYFQEGSPPAHPPSTPPPRPSLRPPPHRWRECHGEAAQRLQESPSSVLNSAGKKARACFQEGLPPAPPPHRWRERHGEAAQRPQEGTPPPLPPSKMPAKTAVHASGKGCLLALGLWPTARRPTDGGNGRGEKCLAAWHNDCKAGKP